MNDILNLPSFQNILDLFYTFGYLFIIIAAVFSLIASAKVNSTFKKYSKIPVSGGMTGADAARMVLTQNGVSGVEIKRTSGSLTDHYDPRDNTIYLSEPVFASCSVGAVGVAAHEAGHAVQHAVGYAPIKLRTAIVPVTNIGSRLSTPLILIGFLLNIYELALIGALAFGLCVVFQLVTLPTEFNASRRAIEALSNNVMMTDDEIKGARKTLTAAAMTYVAALAVAITQFLRLLAMVSGNRRRR